MRLRVKCICVSRAIEVTKSAGRSISSGLLLVVVELAAPLVLAVAGEDEFAVFLDGLGFVLDRAAAAGAADELPGYELLTLPLESRRLFVLPGALAAVALGFLLGEMPLDRGRRNARGEL